MRRGGILYLIIITLVTICMSIAVLSCIYVKRNHVCSDMGSHIYIYCFLLINVRFLLMRIVLLHKLKRAVPFTSLLPFFICKRINNSFCADSRKTRRSNRWSSSTVDRPWSSLQREKCGHSSQSGREKGECGAVVRRDRQLVPTGGSKISLRPPSAFLIGHNLILYDDFWGGVGGSCHPLYSTL